MSDTSLTGQDEARRAMADMIEACLDTQRKPVVGVAAAPEFWRIAIEALRSPSQDRGAEEMKTELRPFASGEGEGLDEVVVQSPTLVHAETMSDTALWIGISDNAGGLLHVWVNAVRKKGKTLLVMTASDEGERDTIAAIRALQIQGGSERG